MLWYSIFSFLCCNFKTVLNLVWILFRFRIGVIGQRNFSYFVTSFWKQLIVWEVLVKVNYFFLVSNYCLSEEVIWFCFFIYLSCKSLGFSLLCCLNSLERSFDLWGGVDYWVLIEVKTNLCCLCWWVIC